MATTIQGESPSGAESERKTQATLVGASCAANTTTVITLAVPGARLNNNVVVNPTTALQAGLGIVGARVSATDTVAITFGNFTAGAIVASNYVFDVTLQKS